MAMDPRDIDLFLRAKKQEVQTRRVTAAMLIAVCASPLLLLVGLDSAYVMSTVAGVLFGGVIANSDLFGGSWRISRVDLLNVIESQINRDPKALEYIKSLDS